MKLAILSRGLRLLTMCFAALAMALLMAVPAFAQNDPSGLGAGVTSAATTAVTAGGAAALIILGAIVLYKVIKRFV